MSLRFAVTVALVGSALTILAAQQPPGPPPATPGMPTAPTGIPPRATRPGEDPQKGASVLRGYVTAAARAAGSTSRTASRKA